VRCDGKKIAVYARYSTDKQNPRSIEDQVRLCGAHAEQAGREVAAVFEDRAVSGASAIRPGYQRMLEAVQAGTVDVVLA